jgi:hypothetical protein
MCKLLATVGKQLDVKESKEKSQEFLNQYFDSLVTLSTSDALSPRIRFMILVCVTPHVSLFFPVHCSISV